MAAFLPGIGLAVVCFISYSVVSISARSLRIYTVIALGMFLIFDTKKIIPGKSSNFGVRGPKDAYFDTCPGTLWLALEKISTLFGSSRETVEKISTLFGLSRETVEKISTLFGLSRETVEKISTLFGSSRENLYFVRVK